MKKKILIVFLICCMLFGVASPAMAADVPPIPEEWIENGYSYFVFNFHSPSAIVYYGTSLDPYLIYYEEGTKTYCGAGFLCDDESDLQGYYAFVSYVPSSQSWQALYFKDLSTKSVVSGQVSVYGASSSTSSNPDPAPLFTPGILYVGYSEYPSDSDWSVFRVAPPLVDLTEELIQMTPEALDLDGKMKILVLFGIGCLALLLSLPLLLKVLRRFLG